MSSRIESGTPLNPEQSIKSACIGFLGRHKVELIVGTALLAIGLALICTGAGIGVLGGAVGYFALAMNISVLASKIIFFVIGGMAVVSTISSTIYSQIHNWTIESSQYIKPKNHESPSHPTPSSTPGELDSRNDVALGSPKINRSVDDQPLLPDPIDEQIALRQQDPPVNVELLIAHLLPIFKNFIEDLRSQNLDDRIIISLITISIMSKIWPEHQTLPQVVANSYIDASNQPIYDSFKFAHNSWATIKAFRDSIYEIDSQFFTSPLSEDQEKNKDQLVNIILQNFICSYLNTNQNSENKKTLSTIMTSTCHICYNMIPIIEELQPYQNRPDIDEMTKYVMSKTNFSIAQSPESIQKHISAYLITILIHQQLQPYQTRPDIDEMTKYVMSKTNLSIAQSPESIQKHISNYLRWLPISRIISRFF